MSELLPAEQKVLDLTAEEMKAYRSVIARPGIAEVVVRIKYDRDTDQPYSVETTVQRRAYYLVQRANQPRPGVLIDRRRAG